VRSGDYTPRRFSRRAVLGGLAVSGCAVSPVRQLRQDAAARLAALEGGHPRARLGAYILNVETGAAIGHRANERFAFCSTFKLPLAAAILREVDRGRLRLEQFVPYGPGDIVMHHPVTGPNLEKGGMSLVALAEAAQKTSDNVAANLLMKMIGGPDGMTAFFRELGDSVSRIDRYEPATNVVPANEVRDTTSPAAIAHTLKLICFGDMLSPASKAMLLQWMIDTTTGAKRIRAGLPEGWRAGDKTGTGLGDGINNFTNDIAVAWPPHGQPAYVIVGFFDAGAAFPELRDEDQAALAGVGRVAATWRG
jgi:beta-lactamase class A